MPYFMKFRKQKPKIDLEDFFKLNFEDNNLWEYKTDDVDLLVEMVDIIRPEDPEAVTTVDISDLIDLLNGNQMYRDGLALYLKQALKQKRFSKILTDAGILTDTDFLYEVRKRLSAKMIPYQPQKNTLEYILNQVFFRKDDPAWLDKIPNEQVAEFYNLINFHSIYISSKAKTPLAELLYAIEVLIHRIAGRALESEVTQMVPEHENLESPFLAIQKEFALISEKLLEERKNFILPKDLGYKQLFILHKQCADYVETAFRNSHKYGISLKLNQNLLRIRQQLKRLKTLLPLLIVDEPEDANKNTIALAQHLIAYNCDKNNVRKLIGESTQLLSYEVTQHTANTGESYITKNPMEYIRMFWTAAGGGIIVGILCIIKVFLSMVDTSAFGHAFLYSINYALGFIAIYVLGFTLATKQPAMTASALVRALENDRQHPSSNKTEKHKIFAEFFARVFRSQFIAFLGNVIVAFPVALLGIWLIDIIFDYDLSHGSWPHLITNLSPVHSMAILHAAIAGVFLFLSGIIAGSVANRDKHQHVYYRIQEHPLLKKKLGRVRTQKLASLYEHKWAGIVSNFWFGVFMGTTGSIGIFLGLNIDIRHITFASGNFALGLYGSHFTLSNEMLFWSILGIGLIGLINFMVSFGLSIALALRSRNIPFSELKYIAKAIVKHFKQKPTSFFFPSLKKQSL